jgi:uncharacterized protein (TIGR03083 family)
MEKTVGTTALRASDVVDAYLALSHDIDALVAGVAPAQWSAPGLDAWSVRDLVGHLGRTLVETYGSHEPAPPALLDDIGYYRAAMCSIGDPAAVAQRGRDAGVALGDNPAVAISAACASVRAYLATAPTHVATPVGPMSVDDYLRTRIVELVVHGDDVARAIGATFPASEAARRFALATLCGLALARGDGAQVSAALTGRIALSDYSVFG